MQSIFPVFGNTLTMGRRRFIGYLMGCPNFRVVSFDGILSRLFYHVAIIIVSFNIESELCVCAFCFCFLC